MSSFVLKLLALVSMTIDHVGMVFFPFDPLFRVVGRMAFPIYAFLCAQGCIHTKNTDRYLLRLGAFALLSEIPYDLAGDGVLFSLQGQNVFFTLFLGALAVKLYRQSGRIRGVLLCVLASELLASDYGWYGVMLVFAFYYFADQRESMLLAFAILTVAFLGYIELATGSGFAALQVWCLSAAVPIWFYNGKRGPSGGKLLFYGYYPLHLLAIFLISHFNLL